MGESVPLFVAGRCNIIKFGMEIRLSAHGPYHHEYHVVWIPKYRERILKGEGITFVEKHIFDIERHRPDIAIKRYSVQIDHAHLIIIIPTKYSVSKMIGKIKAKASRELRHPIEQVTKIYRGNEFWSPGFFSSTVGINEETIKRYVEFQEKLDKGQLQLNLNFKVPRA